MVLQLWQAAVGNRLHDLLDFVCGDGLARPLEDEPVCREVQKEKRKSPLSESTKKTAITPITKAGAGTTKEVATEPIHVQETVIKNSRGEITYQRRYISTIPTISPHQILSAILRRISKNK